MNAFQKILFDGIKAFIGTFKGTDNEGSAKRATVFYFSAGLLTSLLYVYEKAFTVASLAITPTAVQIAIVEMYTTVFWSLLVTIWFLLGLATVETITTLVKLIKGVPEKEKTENNVS